MANFESPIQFERDLRSASQGSKRSKDLNAKWALGTQPLHGCYYNFNGEVTGGDEISRSKTRPWTNRSRHYTKVKQNVVKDVHHNPAGRVRDTMAARDEIKDVSRSIVDLLPSARKSSVADDFLYSYDRTDSPPHILSLDVFIKPNVRETEKLVEKEYEILDTNGDALKGKKARRNLRKGASGMAAEDVPAEVEDDGFELV